MEKRIFNTDEKTELLAQIDPGMPVYDRNGEEIGRVDKVHLGRSLPDGNASTTEKLDLDLTPSEKIAVTLRRMMDELFDPQDQIEEVVQKRLYQQGFIRMDADGLLAGDRYVLADYIQAVKGGGIYLDLTREKIFED